MRLFRKTPDIPYDPETQEPAVRKSICTGEMTVGFIDRRDGKFHEHLCVHTRAELDEFCRSIGVDSIRTIY